MKRTLITICLALLITGCASGPEREISDHFDGRKFYNPTLTEHFSPSLSNVIRMVREGRAKWPKNVENQGVPRLNEKLGPDDMALTFVNHATFLIQLSGLNILTDPVWSDRLGPGLFGMKFGPKRVRAPGVKIEDLPEIDVIIVSHYHYDHLDIETLKKINDRFSPKVLVPVGDGSLIGSIGIKDVRDWTGGKVYRSIPTHASLSPLPNIHRGVASLT